MTTRTVAITGANGFIGSALAARFIAGSALLREESRGAHERSDFPATSPALAERSFLSLDELDRIVASNAASARTRKAGCCG